MIVVEDYFDRVGILDDVIVRNDVPVGANDEAGADGRTATRRIATAFYLITIFFTFFVVFYEKIPDDGRVGIIILCVFVQWAAAGKSNFDAPRHRRGLAPLTAPDRWRGG